MGTFRKVLATSVVLVSSAVFSGYYPSHALDSAGKSDYAYSVNENLSIDDLTSGVEKYLKFNGTNLEFDETLARLGGEPEQIIEAGKNFNKVQAVYSSSSSQQSLPGTAFRSVRSLDKSLLYAQPQRGGVPIWGNWCGPGHSGPGAPVDTLDTLCMRHDKCYAQRGYLSCYCDAQLKEEIDRFSGRMGNAERAMAAAVKLAFMHPFCNPFS